MIKNIFKIITTLIVSAIILLYNNYYNLGVFYFYVLIAFLAYDIISTKKIQLIHIWNGAFLFVILSEVFLRDNLSIYRLEALQLLMLANNIIYIGYLSNTKKHRIQGKTNTKHEFENTSKFSGIGMIFIVLLYVLYNYQSAITSFTLGRDVVRYQDGGSLFLNVISNSIELVLPAIIAYYFSMKGKSVIVPFIVSLPIFVLLLFGGTRYPLLFSVLGFVLTVNQFNTNSKSIKKYILLGLGVFVLIIASSYMRETRSSSAKDQIKYNVQQENEYKDFPTYVSQYMSPEGVVDMNSLMIEHFKNNDFMYGASNSFIFYFWVPRSIWADKPVMLGYWLIRKYRSGFGDAHNASFGFTGDLYADFGYFSLLFIFLLGMLLKFADNYKDRAFSSKNYSVILGSMLYPYVFFFVRSPITSTMSLIWILVFYFLFKRLLFVKV